VGNARSEFGEPLVGGGYLGASQRVEGGEGSRVERGDDELVIGGPVDEPGGEQSFVGGLGDAVVQ
jgi:hypothetical protein